MDELEISGRLFISTRRAAKLHKYHSDYIGQLIRAKKVLGQKVGRSWYVDAASLDAYFAKEGGAPQVLTPEPVLAVSRVEAAPEAPVQPQPVQIETVEAPEEIIEEAAVQEAPLVVAASLEDPEETKVVLRKEVDVSKKFDVEIIENEVEAESEKPERSSMRESLYIPIRRSSAKKSLGLRYIDDTTPALPEIQKTLSRSKLSAVTRMPKSVEEMEPIHDDAQEVKITEDVYTRGRSGIWLPTISIVTLGAIAFAVVAFGSVLVNSHMVIEAGKTASVGYSLQ